MKIFTGAVLAAATLATSIAVLPAAQADAGRPCSSGQVAISASPADAAATHRGVTLTFSLAAGTGPCTLTGYPGVDSDSGGPLIHAARTLRGYMGGLPPTVDAPPTVTLAPTKRAYAVVEGMAADDNGDPCPTYTELRVTALDTTDTQTLATTVTTCRLQVHPVNTTV